MHNPTFFKGKYLLAAGLLLAIVLLSGCKADPCENRTCINGGVCVDGTCDCPEGFIGPDCGIALDPCVNLGCDPLRSTGCVSSGGQAACICVDGYEGQKCDARWSAKFAGKWTVNEACNTGGLLFEADVEEGPILKQITIGNFANKRTSGESAKVVANLLQPDGRILEIYEQFMYFGKVQGSGSLSADGKTIFLNYLIVQEKDSIRCSATLTRP